MANLIHDYTVTSTIGSYTIDLSSTPIVKGELYELMVIANMTVNNNILVNVNNNITNNYSWQYFFASATSTEASRGISPDTIPKITVGPGANTPTTIHVYIKLTNDGRYIFMANGMRKAETTNPEALLIYGASQFTMSSITELNLTTEGGSNTIGAGSRFQLRKIGEKIRDIEVASPETSVTFSNLNIGKDSEYLLLADGINATSQYHRLEIYFNNNLTRTNYSRRFVRAGGTGTAHNYANWPEFGEFNNNTTNRFFSVGTIKLTNTGNAVYMSNMIGNYDNATSVVIQKFYGSSHFTMSSITDITMLHTASSGLGTTSRFELYKLI